MKEKEIRLVFIVGVGRSGTSLLQSMLNAHPDICFPPEINFIRRYLVKDVLYASWRNNGFNEVIEHLKGDKYIARLGLDANDLSALKKQFENDFSSVRLYLSLLRLYASKKGNIKWIGDKDPRSVEFLPVIHRHFPEANVIHIIRDPRDVLVSKKKAAWSQGQSFFHHIFANRIQLKLGRRDGKRLFQERYFELSYESLIRAPEAELSNLCRYLRIPYNPCMLEFADSSKDLVSQEEMQWKKETLGPLLKNNAEQWKKELNKWEIILTEQACSEAIDTIGYQHTVNRRDLPFLFSSFLGFFTSALVLLDFFYINYRQWHLKSFSKFPG